MYRQNVMTGLLIGCCISCASYANAADNEQLSDIYNLSLKELRELSVVTAASGFEQKVSRAPATATVITSEQWQAKGARMLSDVLATVPGFHVGSPQEDYIHKKFMIRGLSGFASNQIKLLVDGEPFEFMQNSSLFFGFQLPLTSFKRIEVIKGPGSAVYGADAFAGVINLVSYKHSDVIPSKLGGRAGSFNTSDFFARDSLTLGDSHFQWSLDYSYSDDDKNRIVESDLQSVFDQIFGTSASKTPGPIDERYEVLTLLAKWQWHNWRVNYFNWRNFDIGHGSGVGQALDPRGGSAIYDNHLGAEYDFSQWVRGDLKAKLIYKRQNKKPYLTVFPAGAILPVGVNGHVNFANSQRLVLFEDGFIGTPSASGDTTTFRLTHLLRLTNQHMFRWATGFEDQRFRVRQRKNTGPGVLDNGQTVATDQLTDITNTPYTFLPNIDRHFYYLSLQDEWQVNPEVLLTLGVRYDRYSDFGSTTNPRLGLIWQATDDLAVKLFAGSAFRAPAIGQLYSQNNPVSIGNTQLQPETVDTLETGFNAEYMVNSNFTLSLNLFDYHAKDLIVFAPYEGMETNVAQNIGEQKGRGGEFGLKWKPQTNMTIDFNYSVLSAEDKNGVDIADTPNKMAYLGFNWQIHQHWYGTMDVKWIAEQPRRASDNRGRLGNYSLVNAKLERKNIVPGLSAAVMAKNLFDNDAREPSDGTIPDDYPLAGRQLLFELVYLF